MMTLQGTNVNVIYPVGIHMLQKYGVKQESQHGTTLEIPEPVSVCYENPRERCLFDADRDSNPFLNLFEALWILAGRNDVAFLQPIVGRMATYSDDGKTYYGAYGHRMRHATCGGDQIEEAVERLQGNPNDRQVVLTIRRANDMAYYGKDQPCNLMAALKIREGRLNMHVFNRSNDFIWGLTGTNVVQFSMLQEYLAGRIGVPVGVYHQTTDSCHVYVNDQWEKVRNAHLALRQVDHYASGAVRPADMMAEPHKFDEDLLDFFNAWDADPESVFHRTFDSKFFKDIVLPAWEAFLFYRKFREEGDVQALINARYVAESLPPGIDWSLMIQNWLARRGVK